MTISSETIWEVRTDGDDDNSGRLLRESLLSLSSSNNIIPFLWNVGSIPVGGRKLLNIGGGLVG